MRIKKIVRIMYLLIWPLNIYTMEIETNGHAPGGHHLLMANAWTEIHCSSLKIVQNFICTDDFSIAQDYALYDLNEKQIKLFISIRLDNWTKKIQEQGLVSKNSHSSTLAITNKLVVNTKIPFPVLNEWMTLPLKDLVLCVFAIKHKPIYQCPQHSPETQIFAKRFEALHYKFKNVIPQPNRCWCRSMQSNNPLLEMGCVLQ